MSAGSGREPVIVPTAQPSPATRLATATVPPWCDEHGGPLPCPECPDLSAERAMHEREELDKDTAWQLRQMRARQSATETLRAEGAVPIPAGVSLRDLLAEPKREIRYRVKWLWPAGGKVMLSAQYKSGKTTLRDNLVRALVDDRPFLDKFPVNALRHNETVVIVDTEMSRDMIREWLGDQRIANDDRVRVYPLRGAVSAFSIIDKGQRATWVRKLRADRCAVLVLDCLGPVLAAFGMDESSNPDVGAFLAALDALCADAGIREAIVIHHMGHGAERARGASRLRDWPDAEWKLTRDDEGDGRFFGAYGRDVAWRESALVFDPLDRHLTLVSGTRAESQLDALVRLIDTTGLPNDASRGKIRNAGVSGGNVELAAAIKVRKARACPEMSVLDTSENQLSLDLADTAGQLPDEGGETVGA